MRFTFIIQNDAILNNYISLLKLLSIDNHLFLIIEESVFHTADLLALNNTKIFEYRIQPKLAFWEDIFNYAYIGRKRHTSISFEERFNWRTPKFADFRKDNYGKSLRAYFYRLRRYTIKHKDVILINILSKTRLDIIFRPVFYQFFRVQDYLKAFNEIPIASIVVVPYWGINVECNFILSEINKQRKKKFKSLFIQENWDNLSSKSLMFYKPNVLTVWGEQTKKHAIEIQGMDVRYIKYLQSPRYITFYDAWQKQRSFELERETLNKNKVILYIGDSTDTDEVEIINQLSEFILNQNLGYQIIYRPHPFQKSNYKRKFSKNAIPRNVRLDEEFSEIYFDGKRSLSTKSNQNVLLNNLLKCDAFICGGSTSFLEALLMYKPIMLINGKIRSTTILRKEHFRGVENLDYVYIVNEGEIGNDQWKDFFDKVENFQAGNLEVGKTDYFFDLGEKSYLDKFIEIAGFTSKQ